MRNIQLLNKYLLGLYHVLSHMRTKLSGFRLMAQCVACLITVLKFSLRQPMYYCSWPLGCLISILSILSILLCPKHIVNHSASKTTCLQSSQSNNHSLSLPFFPMQSKDLMSFLLFSLFLIFISTSENTAGFAYKYTARIWFTFSTLSTSFFQDTSFFLRPNLCLGTVTSSLFQLLLHHYLHSNYNWFEHL